MSRYSTTVALAIGAAACVCGASPVTAAGPTSDPTSRPPSSAPRAHLPVWFEPNVGQSGEATRFVARPSGYTAFLAPTEAVFALPECDSARRLTMSFVGAREAAVARERDPRPGRSHYLVGADRSAWITDVPHAGRVVVEGLYPGVDLRWRGTEDGALEYDFVVAPCADPALIRLAFEGAEAVEVTDDGDLRVRTMGGAMLHSAPVAFQGSRRVSARFATAADGSVRIEVAGYDRSRPLLIDPEIGYSTYLGGTGTGIGDAGTGVAVDAGGAVYVTGGTTSSDFPTKAALQGTLGGGSADAFVAKIDAQGALVFSTFLGGSDLDVTLALALDAQGAPCVAGYTKSSDYPTKSARQSKHGGGMFDGFVSKLKADGSALEYSTYHGGTGDDWARGLAVDGSGAAYVTGNTTSTDFPTQSPFQGTHGGGTDDAFLSKLTAAGNGLSYSTYLGGSQSESGAGVAVDTDGAAIVVGWTTSTNFPSKSAVQATHGGGTYDAFVSKVAVGGGSLTYSTYLGGSDIDRGAAIAVDGNGAAYVTGETRSSDFPTKAPLYGTLSGGDDVFVSSIVKSGASLRYSTYLGGSARDAGYAIGVGPDGAVWVTGITFSTDFPTASPLQSQRNGSRSGFVSNLSQDASALDFSTYLGGDEQDWGLALAIAGRGGAVVSGNTTSTDFPTVNPIQATNANGGGFKDVFVTHYAGDDPPEAPSALTTTDSSATRVGLAWGGSLDASGYELERNTEGGSFALLTEPAASATTYADTTVAADTSYTYRIRAINDNGPSEWSNEVTVLTIDSPDQLAGDPVSNTRIDLTWRDRSATEDGFEVARKQAGAEEFITLDTLAAGVTSLTDSGVDPETTYNYRVRATKDGGASGWSNVAEVTTPPADPANVVPSNAADAEVRIHWSDLSDAETGYEVERGLGCPPAVWALLATVGPDVTEYFDDSAAPETTYSYRVRAVNAHGHSGYTTPVCITTPPMPPSGFTAAAGSPSRIGLTWTDNSSLESGYEVQRSISGRDEWEDVADLPADSVSYTDAGVSPESAFDYRVRAYDDNGRSRNVTAEDVSTPAALVVRVAKLLIPTGRAARRRKPTLLVRGEVDVGGTAVDLEGAATLWLGETQIAVSGFTSLRRGRILRYDEDGVRLDLRPAPTGASRVPFTLLVVGDVAAGLDRDGELFLRFRSGAFDAMGVVTLGAGQFNPARGRGTWIDPPLNLLSVAATPARRSFRMTATFPPADRPDTAPEVSVLLDIFEISFEPGAFKRRGRTKYVLARRLGPVRQKVVLDYRRGTLSIVLRGVALQSYEPGTVLVPLAVAIGTTRLEDKPMLVVTKRSFRY